MYGVGRSNSAWGTGETKGSEGKENLNPQKMKETTRRNLKEVGSELESMKASEKMVVEDLEAKIPQKADTSSSYVDDGYSSDEDDAYEMAMYAEIAAYEKSQQEQPTLSKAMQAFEAEPSVANFEKAVDLVTNKTEADKLDDLGAKIANASYDTDFTSPMATLLVKLRSDFGL